jgi:hypothetical protein
MAPWNPLQFLQQQGARAQRAIQNIPRMAGQVQQQIQPIIRTVTNSPVVRPVVQQYRRIPPSVRSAVNPLSTAQPVRWPGAARSLGANLLVDTLVEEAATRLLPKQQAAEVTDFYTFTSLPFGGPLQRLAGYVVLRPTPVGATEDQTMAQIRKEYEESKRRQQQRQNQPMPAASPADLQLVAPAAPAYRTPAPREATRAYVAPPSPRQAAATPAAPSAPVTAVEPGAAQVRAASPLAETYAQQKRIGELLGAQEMIRRLNQAEPMSTVDDENLREWATANPALAYREMLRRERLNTQTSSL